MQCASLASQTAGDIDLPQSGLSYVDLHILVPLRQLQYPKVPPISRLGAGGKERRSGLSLARISQILQTAARGLPRSCVSLFLTMERDYGDDRPPATSAVASEALSHDVN